MNNFLFLREMKIFSRNIDKNSGRTVRRKALNRLRQSQTIALCKRKTYVKT
jgi:hypothetical protein